MNNASTGTLTNTTPVPVGVSALNLPLTITLKSADAGRKIEVSSDGGTEYWTPTVDKSTATMQVVYITVPVSNVKFTGAANDTWSIR